MRGDKKPRSTRGQEYAMRGGVEGSFRFKLRSAYHIFTGYTAVDERRGLPHEWSHEAFLAQTL